MLELWIALQRLGLGLLNLPVFVLGKFSLWATRRIQARDAVLAERWAAALRQREERRAAR